MKRCLGLLFFLVTTLAQATPLPAAEIFQVQVSRIDPNTFTIDWQIKPNYFLYADRIHVTTPADSNVRLADLRFPLPEQKTDKLGHQYPIYRNKLNLPVSVLGEQAGESLIQFSYQGCADDGFCYPPIQRLIKLSINQELSLSDATLEEETTATVTADTPPASTQDLTQILARNNWPMTLLIFYGFGLLLAFTPCILPMVPVLSGIIVGHGSTVTTKKAFFLSLSYVLSMSLTYAVFGAVVALVGANLQISMQSPWAISLFSLVFVLLALSMFGFYEFKLPQAWQTKIAGASGSQRRGHYLGAAIMGCLSTLILSPCVTAPLIGVLTYIAHGHDVLLGSIILFILSLGMGTPLLLIGTSAGRWLPKSGAWMNTVKAFFGVMLLAVAIYLLARILPDSVTMLLWSCLFIFCGIYVGALTPSLTPKEKFCQGVGIILFSYGLIILLGASMGATNPLQPLVKKQIPNTQIPLTKQTITTVEQQIKQAKGMPVMLDFYADWCSSCKMMAATTFKDPQVKQALSQFKVIKIDVTANTNNNRQLMSYFKVIAPPTFVFFNKQGQILESLTVVGETSATDFLKKLKQID